MIALLKRFREWLRGSNKITESNAVAIEVDLNIIPEDPREASGITSRVCRKCNEEKSMDCYYKRRKTRYWECIDCYKERHKETLKDEYSRLGRIRLSQKANSKQRNHPKPAYTRERFYQRAMSNGYSELYEKWVESGHEQLLTPSCDRIDSNLPYTKENIQMMTRGENKEKGDYLPA